MSTLRTSGPCLRPSLWLMVVLLQALSVSLGIARASEPTPVKTLRTFDLASHPGLPSSTITDLAQDDRGVLWIATPRGLATFDGVAIKPHAEGRGGPPQGHGLSLLPRRAGGVFVVTADAVYAWDHRRWRTIAAPKGSISIAEDGESRLWAVGTDGVLRRRSSEDGDWSEVPLAEPVLTVKVSLGGALWILGAHHVFLWDDKDGAVRLRAYPSEPVAAVAAADGTLWLAARDGGIYSTSRSAGSWARADAAECGGDRIRRLAEDGRGRIWAALNAGGVCFGTSGSRWTVWGSEHGLTEAGTLTILSDREGSLWIGYNGGGLQQWIGEAWSHRRSWGPASNRRKTSVSSIAGTSDGHFLATVAGQGVWRWDGVTMHELADDLQEDPFTAVEPEPGIVWVGTREGIFEGEKDGSFHRVLTVPGTIVSNFFASPAGRWYATTRMAGIFVRSPRGWEPATELNRALPDADVRAMLWRSDGALLVGTLSGLTVFSDGRPRVIPTGSVGMPLSVTDLIELPTGEVWISGTGGVSVLLHDRVTRLQTDRDLPGPTIAALALSPDGSVWLSGDGGLARWRNRRLERFGRADGLLDTEGLYGSLWVAPAGEVLLGTMSGLTRFDPAVRVPGPVSRPRLSWKHETAEGGSAEKREIQLSWSAPWLLPRPMEYRHRVSRLGSGWSPAQSSSSLMLGGLGPGEWTVEVAARLVGEGAWSDPIATTFTITPRWWETVGARVAGLVMIAILLYTVYRLRTRLLRRQAERLERIVARRTASLRAAHGELRVANGRLARLARTDGLTGLLNRASFDEALELEWKRGWRLGTDLAVVMIDVDHFKRFNDTYGHPKGDACLRAVASALGEVAGRRAGDVVARYGGEEFVLLLPATDPEGARTVAESICVAVSKVAIPHAASPTAPHVTISVGVAGVIPHSGFDAGRLVELADRALYLAKEEGRNRVLLLTPTTQPLRIARLRAVS